MDVDYCFEARLRGFRLYQVPVRLTHHENRTTRSMLDNDPAAKAAVAFNLQTFYDKWSPLAPYLPSRIHVGRETFGFGSRMLRSSRKLFRRVR
jgi:GT2 family glycosyltransferase